MSTNETRRAGIEARAAIGKVVTPVTRHEVALQHYLAAAAYHEQVGAKAAAAAPEPGDGHRPPAHVLPHGRPPVRERKHRPRSPVIR